MIEKEVGEEDFFADDTQETKEEPKKEKKQEIKQEPKDGKKKEPITETKPEDTVQTSEKKEKPKGKGK